ncbi:MAG TPA: class I fructose-bisphosphate aldolase, partial [Dehalococcoidia bacterium]|nr:class I fructose-bisphosphate aldolase [Dehalococcoidia bacterium]
PSMVLSGKEASHRAGPEEVAEKTVTCLKRTVPAAVSGIVFLSGGQVDDEATVNLNAINVHAAGVGAPWQLSFSYGRALQGAPLEAWGGKSENVPQARQAFYHRAYVVSAARQAIYTPEMEVQPAGV